MILNLQRDLYFHNELLWVDLVSIKHLELELEGMNSYPSLHVLRHYCRLVEACSSLDKLVIKVCINLAYVDAIIVITLILLMFIICFVVSIYVL